MSAFLTTFVSCGRGGFVKEGEIKEEKGKRERPKAEQNIVQAS